MKSEILSILKNSKDFVSGEELSKKLGVSRTAVWKNINSLRNDGYIINSVTNKGYMLTECPDILDADIISDGLDTKLAGKKIITLKTVDSTNEEVKRRASNGEESGLVVTAEEQTSGKGRLGRVWESQSGNGIYFTLLIRPDLPPYDISSITLAAGYAVCLAIREYTGCDAKIKWPNDIIIGNKKVCGILTEMAAQSDRLDFVAIGIGINVNNTDFPQEIRHKATSLFLESGNKINRNEFLRCVIKTLDTVLCSFLVSLSLEDVQNFKALCATLGKNVSVNRNNKILEGVAVDVNLNGELIIKDHEGNNITVNSGEVTVQGIY